jgi:hypothetical protein
VNRYPDKELRVIFGVGGMLGWLFLVDLIWTDSAPHIGALEHVGISLTVSAVWWIVLLVMLRVVECCPPPPDEPNP